MAARSLEAGQGDWDHEGVSEGWFKELIKDKNLEQDPGLCLPR